VSPKRDAAQVDAVAREFGMKPEDRRSFGKFLESEKAHGDRGAANRRGDYTMSELRQKAKDFLESTGGSDW
jgi:hypothetical protein